MNIPSIKPFLIAEYKERLISNLLDQKRFNEACDDLSGFVNSLCFSDEFKGKQIYLPNLDDLVERIGIETLQPITTKKLLKNLRYPVIVATEMYVDGGHSRIIEELIRLRGGIVVLTNYFGGFDKTKADPPKANLPVLTLPVDSPTNNIIRLNNICNAVGSEVYVLTHHHDVVATAAVSCAMSIPVYFIHHSDHKVSLGPTIKNFIHVDIAPHVHEICSKFLKPKIEYWPQGVDDLGLKIFTYPLNEVCSASSGSWHKFSWEGEYAYPKIIRILLSRPGSSHFHIGILSDSLLKKIKEELKTNAIPLERFHYIGHVQSLWQALLDLPVNVFVGSCPMHGLRTAIEVQGSGVPIIPFLQSEDTLLYDKSFYNNQTVFWSSPEKLDSITQEVLNKHHFMAAASRRHYEETFHPNLMKEAIDQSILYYRN